MRLVSKSTTHLFDLGREYRGQFSPYVRNNVDERNTDGLAPGVLELRKTCPFTDLPSRLMVYCLLPSHCGTYSGAMDPIF